MDIARVLLLLLLAVSPALAQDLLVPAIASPVVIPDAPTPQPPKPQQPRATDKVVDKKFIAAMAALGAAESLRFTTRQLVLVHEFAAGAPWVTGVPSSPHLVARHGNVAQCRIVLVSDPFWKWR